MIDPKELRIGNWVQTADDHRQGYVIWFNPKAVKLRLEHSVCTIKSHGKFARLDIDPIPLTPEILIACGFEGDSWKVKSMGNDLVGPGGKYEMSIGLPKDNSYAAIILHSSTGEGFTIREVAKMQEEFAISHPDKAQLSDSSFIPMKMGEKFVLRQIKYLHELQNIWHSLTGEELNYKP